MRAPADDPVRRILDACKHGPGIDRAIVKRLEASPEVRKILITLAKRLEALPDRALIETARGLGLIDAEHRDPLSEKVRQRACLDKLQHIISAAIHTKDEPTARDSAEWERMHAEAAHLCRQYLQSEWAAVNEEMAKALGMAADFFERFRQIGTGFKFLTTGKSEIRNARARAYVVHLSMAMRDSFGSPQYGTVATIASVALGREISPKKVENWTRTHVARLRGATRKGGFFADIASILLGEKVIPAQIKNRTKLTKR
jgi:hypothetical protein